MFEFGQNNRKARRSASRYGARRARGGHQHSADAEKIKKLALIAAMPVVALGIGGYALSAYLKTEKIGPDYCFARADQHEVAVFVDASFTNDSSQQQWRDYQTVMRRAFETAPPNARVSLFSTARNVGSSLLNPVGSVCKPPATPEELEALNAPSQTAPYLARQSEEAADAYNALADRVLSDAANAQLAAGDSPILESLQAISRSDYFDGPNRTLWAITDGIQNAEIRFCSVRGAMPRYAQFEQSAAFSSIRPEPYTGAEVNFLLVESIALPQPGLDYCTHGEMRAWWPDYFRGNGAQSVQLTRLRHGVE